MARVVLIYPIGGSMLDVVSRRIPLGLLAVAAFLDKDGYDVKIIDQRVDKDWKKTLLNELKLNPICVGLSCSTGQQLIYASKQFFNNNLSIEILLGSIGAAILPQPSYYYISLLIATLLLWKRYLLSKRYLLFTLSLHTLIIPILFGPFLNLPNDKLFAILGIYFTLFNRSLKRYA